MSDRHLQWLTAQARRDQRRLAEHEALGASTDAASAMRRDALRLRSARTRARLAAALDRRRLGAGA